MQIEIFDVGHGHCSVMTAPNGARMMLDCGKRWDQDRFWAPSVCYAGESIALLALLNLDEDHIGDFGPMRKHCSIQAILSNPTIGAREFELLKKDGMRAGAKAVLEFLAAPKFGLAPTLDFGQVEVRWYWNLYGGDCKTTNDLSLAIVLQYGNFKILFAGDLEANGWRGMLKNQQFRQELLGINVFVASHHGRKSGCHDAVFELMKPDIVVISDTEMQHDSQETNAWYRQRCHGIGLISDPKQRRHVLTTRNDGSMRINVNADGRWTINWRVPVTDWPVSPPKPTYNSLADPFGFNALNNPLSLGGRGLINSR